MADLFGATASGDNYDASNIEVLEGLEPVRHRPGMYIGKLGDGSSDDDGIYVLLKEVLDNILTASPSKEGLLDNLTKFIPSSQFSNEVKKPSV